MGIRLRMILVLIYLQNGGGGTEYEKLGIGEYWIVDYLGLGGRRYIGDPKQPTLSVYNLVEGEYALNLFRGENVVASPTFPELNLTAEQIFKARQ